jgi:hypothetical protein
MHAFDADCLLVRCYTLANSRTEMVRGSSVSDVVCSRLRRPRGTLGCHSCGVCKAILLDDLGDCPTVFQIAEAVNS